MRRHHVLGLIALVVLASPACKRKRSHSTPTPASTTTTTLGELSSKSDPIPAPGKGNVKGVVLYDGKPSSNVDVRLCETFSSLGVNGCSGRTYSAKTDATGAFLIRDVPPKEYGALLVFEPNGGGRYQYQAPKNEFLGAQKHIVRAGTTIDAGTTNLFRQDLHIELPRSAQRTTSVPELRWTAYPGAIRYELTLSRPLDAREDSAPSIYEKTTATTFTPMTPLAPGRWELSVQAHSARGKLSETPDRLLFIVDEEHARLEATPAPAPAKKPPVPTFNPVTPSAGTGAVQGVILHDDRPASGIEVKLCETFDPWFSGCGGKIFTTKTNAEGIYLFADIAPKDYQGLTARVFKTNDVIYMSAGIAGSKTYTVDADKTLTPLPTNLFKNDLKVIAPNGKAKNGALEVKWAPYANAAFYKFSIHGRGATPTPPYSSMRVDEPKFVLDKPLLAGTYQLSVQAFNAAGTKLAENGKGGEFTVTK